MNTIKAIHPYKRQDLWVFDDEKAGLEQEPFIEGADDGRGGYVGTGENHGSGWRPDGRGDYIETGEHHVH